MRKESIAGKFSAIFVIVLTIMNILLHYDSKAQTPTSVLNPLPCPDNSTLPSGCPTKAYNLSFEVNGTATTGTWIITGNLPPGLSFNTNIGAISGVISATAAGNTYQFSISCSVSGTLFHGDFNLQVYSLANPCASSMSPFKICPCLHEMVYVLDRSGSMNWAADPAIPVSSTNNRWVKLKQMVTDHLSGLSMLGAASGLNIPDKWSGVFFWRRSNQRIERGFWYISNN